MAVPKRLAQESATDGRLLQDARALSAGILSEVPESVCLHPVLLPRRTQGPVYHVRAVIAGTVDGIVASKGGVFKHFHRTPLGIKSALEVLFWTCTLSIVVLFVWTGAARDKKDTCPITLLLVPTTILTLALARYTSVMELFWIFSENLEGFAMLPQYVFSMRDRADKLGHGGHDCAVLTYVLTLGGYRTFYNLSWLYKAVENTPFEGILLAHCPLWVV